jgi:hypothetical protein
VKFSVCPSILLNSRECSPLGVNEGVNIPPRGQISPLGAKFTPRGEVIPRGPGVKLRNSSDQLARLNVVSEPFPVEDELHLEVGVAARPHPLESIL